MDPNLFTLNWKNQIPTFSNAFSSIRNKSLSFSDATIACDGKLFPVHKLILSSCSDYFQKIFEDAEKFQCKHPFIFIRDAKREILEYLLQFMYCGKVDISHDNLPGLMQLARDLQIKVLSKNIENYPAKITDKRPLERECESDSGSKRKRIEPVSLVQEEGNQNESNSHIDVKVEINTENDNMNENVDYCEDDNETMGDHQNQSSRSKSCQEADFDERDGIFEDIKEVLAANRPLTSDGASTSQFQGNPSTSSESDSSPSKLEEHAAGIDQDQRAAVWPKVRTEHLYPQENMNTCLFNCPCIKDVKELKWKVAKQEKKINQILMKYKENPVDLSNIEHDVLPMPAETTEELYEIAQSNLLIPTITSLCGSKPMASTRYIIRRLMSQYLALQYSLSGLGTKRAHCKLSFKDHPICNFVVDVIMKQHGCKKEEVLSCISNVLKGAVDWDGGRKKRAMGLLPIVNNYSLEDFDNSALQRESEFNFSQNIQEELLQELKPNMFLPS